MMSLAVELLVCNGVGGWGWPISFRVVCSTDCNGAVCGRAGTLRLRLGNGVSWWLEHVGREGGRVVGRWAFVEVLFVVGGSL